MEWLTFSDFPRFLTSSLPNLHLFLGALHLVIFEQPIKKDGC